MNPSTFEGVPLIVALRDALHADLAERFDCALCNYYTSAAACAWHQDPEHGDAIDGAKWERPTFVVSCGETRRFAFRPVRAHISGGGARISEEGGGEDEGGRHTVPLFSGDVISMDGACNDDFEHSVLSAQGEANEAARVSIVFKRAIAGRDGRRGHTLEGEGRRARARRAREQRQGGPTTGAARAGGGRAGATPPRGQRPRPAAKATKATKPRRTRY